MIRYPSTLPNRPTANHVDKLRSRFRPGTRWWHASLGRIEARYVRRNGNLRFRCMIDGRSLEMLWPFYLAVGRLTRRAARSRAC